MNNYSNETRLASIFGMVFEGLDAYALTQKVNSHKTLDKETLLRQLVNENSINSACLTTNESFLQINIQEYFIQNVLKECYNITQIKNSDLSFVKVKKMLKLLDIAAFSFTQNSIVNLSLNGKITTIFDRVAILTGKEDHMDKLMQNMLTYCYLYINTDNENELLALEQDIYSNISEIFVGTIHFIKNNKACANVWITSVISEYVNVLGKTNAYLDPNVCDICMACRVKGFKLPVNKYEI
ncbi:MAG: hypothetical protein RSB51_05740 [Clostridia bacterium]